MPDIEFYDGVSTGQQIDESVQKGIVTVNLGTVSALPVTVNNANILESHVVLYALIGTPSAQNGQWAVTTSNGSLTVSGSIRRSTSVVLYLGRNAQTVSA